MPVPIPDASAGQSACASGVVEPALREELEARLQALYRSLAQRACPVPQVKCAL